ncbi:hypothetical protein [Halovenus halobia]|uniref:hypothetical protein n=1 Tax=Halovenus halobia TaxID=3396622 RepID=UPI003F57D3FE
MANVTPETAAEPDRLSAALPTAPGVWERTDHEGGIVEYVIAGDEGVCTAAKLVVRPEVIQEAAVRLDRKRDCAHAGTDRFSTVEAAAETVENELTTVMDSLT